MAKDIYLKSIREVVKPFMIKAVQCDVQCEVLHVRAVQLVNSRFMSHVMKTYFPLVRVKGKEVDFFLQQNLAL